MSILNHALHGQVWDNDGQSMSKSNKPNPALKFQKPAKKAGYQPGNTGQQSGNDRAINCSLKY